VVLGALLLVLVSELALSVVFVAFVVLFTVMAIGAAATGRSEAEAEQATVIGETRPFVQLTFWLGFAAVVVLAAGMLFLLMPRVSSRQVAQANWLPSRLDLGLAGRVRLPDMPGAAADPGIIISLQDPGAGTGGHAVLGYTGSSANTPVMNVRSQISSYWRGMVLDRYDGRGWLSSSARVNLVDAGLGEFRLADSRTVTPGERAYWQLFYVLTDQPNAVFTGYNPGRLYFSGLDPAGLTAGTLYRSLSAVPSVRPERLRGDVAVSDRTYLDLPPVPERTLALARSVAAGAASDFDKAARIERFLSTNYRYSLDVGPLPPGRDAVDYFLFEQQSGYCAHFATAMAVMARAAGLPARVAAGYLPGYIDPLTGAHVVRAGDAHAWVEIRFRDSGWVAFDPTPRPDAAMGFVGAGSRLRFGLEDFTGVSLGRMLQPGAGLVPGRLPVAVWYALGLGAGAFLAAVLVLRLCRRAEPERGPMMYSRLDGEGREAVLRLYRRMLRMLEKKGFPARGPCQPPEEYAAVIAIEAPGAREAVEYLTRLASRAAYDPGPFDPPDIRQLRQSLFELARRLKGKS
jgi:hypothetical protein